jgi:hypothetical protein
MVEAGWSFWNSYDAMFWVSFRGLRNAPSSILVRPQIYSQKEAKKTFMDPGIIALKAG